MSTPAREKPMDPNLPSRLDMSGRRALVVGVASGMGQQTAYVMADLGADLILTDIQSMDAKRERLSANGVEAQCPRGDLAEDAFVNSLIANCPYFSLAHCAAIFRAPTHLKDGEAFNFLMRVNLRAAFRLASGCITQMAARDKSYVVLVGSAAGRTASS